MRVTIGRMAVLITLLVWGMAGIAAAQSDAPRIALIVGNGGYSSVTPLDNPVSDAELMAQTLEARGFVVTLLPDANQVTMNRAIAQFGRDLLFHDLG